MIAVISPNLMSFEEYLIWESTQEERHEFWDGEIVAMSGGTRSHNRISLNFSKILDEALADRQCEVYIADIKVQVQPNQKYFYPDVVVTCDQRDRTETQWVLFPCLIIEVLSPSTEAFDRGLKFAQYRKSTSLQEYVLVQVGQPMVEVFRRSSDQNSPEQWIFSEYGLGDRFLLTSVQVEIAVSDLYRQVQFES